MGYAKWRPDLYAEMWSMISDLMLELEIPMLKGRTRNQYAIEQDVSPWSIGMLSDQIDDKNTKNDICTNSQWRYSNGCMMRKQLE